MSVILINPKNKSPLKEKLDTYIDDFGNVYPIIKGVGRFTSPDNYSKSFGLQWNTFDKTQFDRGCDGLLLSKQRFFGQSNWSALDLEGKDILEVGAGAGRFSRVVLEQTRANLYSIDYSDAVTANFRNNSKIDPDRFKLFQASVYEMPFPDDSFDKVFCFGVLQHTPDFRSSIKALIAKAKVGGEIVVDFYPIKGWWTKVHAKYLLRPWTKSMDYHDLLGIINNNIDWLIKVSKYLIKFKLGVLTRMVPIVDLRTIPHQLLSDSEFREWVILDTFDMFSPENDHPQKLEDVAEMFTSSGAKVTFSGFVEYTKGFNAAVVRGIKQA